MAQRAKVTSGLSFIPKDHMAEEEKTPASCPLARIQNKQVMIFKKRVFSDLIPKPMGTRDLRGQPAICVCTTPVRQFQYTKEMFKKRWVHIPTSCLPCLRATFNGSVRCSKSSDVSGFYILTVKWGNQDFVSHHQQWISHGARFTPPTSVHGRNSGSAVLSAPLAPHKFMSFGLQPHFQMVFSSSSSSASFCLLSFSFKLPPLSHPW